MSFEQDHLSALRRKIRRDPKARMRKQAASGQYRAELLGTVVTGNHARERLEANAFTSREDHAPLMHFRIRCPGIRDFHCTSLQFGVPSVPAYTFGAQR